MASDNRFFPSTQGPGRRAHDPLARDSDDNFSVSSLASTNAKHYDATDRGRPLPDPQPFPGPGVALPEDSPDSSIPDAEDQLIAHNETVLILDKFNFSDPHDGTLPADALVTLWATTNAGLAYPSATTSDFATQSFFISNSCMSTRSIAAA